jgi:hypothetical protein
LYRKSLLLMLPPCEALVTASRWDANRWVGHTMYLVENVSSDQTISLEDYRSQLSLAGSERSLRKGCGIEWDQKLVHFHVLYHLSWIWTRNTCFSSVSIIDAMFDLIVSSYLSPKIYTSRYWSLCLPVTRWHCGLEEPTCGSVGFLEIHVHQKVSLSPSDHLFSAP